MAFIKFLLREENRSVSDIFGHMFDQNYICLVDAETTCYRILIMEEWAIEFIANTGCDKFGSMLANDVFLNFVKGHFEWMLEMENQKNLLMLAKRQQLSGGWFAP